MMLKLYSVMLQMERQASKETISNRFKICVDFAAKWFLQKYVYSEYINLIREQRWCVSLVFLAFAKLERMLKYEKHHMNSVTLIVWKQGLKKNG